MTPTPNNTTHNPSAAFVAALRKAAAKRANRPPEAVRKNIEGEEAEQRKQILGALNMVPPAAGVPADLAGIKQAAGQMYVAIVKSAKRFDIAGEEIAKLKRELAASEAAYK